MGVVCYVDRTYYVGGVYYVGGAYYEWDFISEHFCCFFLPSNGRECGEIKGGDIIRGGQ